MNAERKLLNAVRQVLVSKSGGLNNAEVLELITLIDGDAEKEQDKDQPSGITEPTHDDASNKENPAAVENPVENLTENSGSEEESAGVQS